MISIYPNPYQIHDMRSLDSTPCYVPLVELPKEGIGALNYLTLELINYEYFSPPVFSTSRTCSMSVEY